MTRWPLALAALLALAGATGCPTDPDDDDSAVDDDDSGPDDDDAAPDDDDSGPDDDDVAPDDDDVAPDDDDFAPDDDDFAPPELYAFFAVHLDPGSPPVDDGQPSSARPEEHLPSLAQLVAAADVAGHELTLMFTAQWASYVASGDCVVPDDGDADGGWYYDGQERNTCLELVRAWEGADHEIAMHHHRSGAPASWDGFSNGPPVDHPHYLGDMLDLMAFVDQLPAAGPGSVLSATSEEFPVGPNSLQFTSARGPTPYVGPADGGDLASTPCAWTEDDHWVWRWRMRSFTSDLAQQVVLQDELPQALIDLPGHAEGPFTLGFVTHAKNVTDTSIVGYEQLFGDLAGAGVTLEGLAGVASWYVHTMGNPEQAEPDLACPKDEG